MHGPVLRLRPHVDDDDFAASCLLQQFGPTQRDLLLRIGGDLLQGHAQFDQVRLGDLAQPDPQPGDVVSLRR